MLLSQVIADSNDSQVIADNNDSQVIADSNDEDLLDDVTGELGSLMTEQQSLFAQQVILKPYLLIILHILITLFCAFII